jgi:NADH dehydrogenase
MAKKVVIIGGGFAGINLAKKLGRTGGYHITLVDKNDYYFFPPLLYQVATSFLDPSSICYPFRRIFRGYDTVRFRMGAFIRVDPVSHTCYLDNGELSYDILVFATGARTNFFGNGNIQEHAIRMKTIEDALHTRNALLSTMEKASITPDPAERKKLLTLVVAGGGPTGVEVAGMLAELRKYVIAKDYPEFRDADGDIYLVEGSGKLLATMSAASSKDAADALAKLGVEIRTNLFVKDFDGDTVVLSDGETIAAKTLIWTAGVTAAAFDGIPPASIGPGKRMIVDEYNKVQGVEDIYAIGDNCIRTTDKRYPNGHPQLAQVAIQQGQNLAGNLAALLKGRPQKAFHYFDKGTMAIIGRNKAVVDLVVPKWHLRGFIALLIWLFIHLMGLINYRNKIRTVLNWIGAYLNKDQSLRMILRSDPR